MARKVDPFSTFLKTVNQRPQAEPSPQPRSASDVNLTERILDIVMANPNGMDVRNLLEQSQSDVIEFGKALERLQSLDAVTRQSNSVFPGPKCNDVRMLLRPSA